MNRSECDASATVEAKDCVLGLTVSEYFVASQALQIDGSLRVFQKSVT